MGDTSSDASMKLERNLNNPQLIKKSHVTRACTRCRTAKAKCDGKQPCSTCQRSSVQCVFTNRDLRFKEHRVSADSLTDLRASEKLLVYIWDVIQQDKDDRIPVDIRSGLSFHDLVRKYLEPDPSLTDRSQPPSLPSQSSSDIDTPLSTFDRVDRPDAWSREGTERLIPSPHPFPHSISTRKSYRPVQHQQVSSSSQPLLGSGQQNPKHFTIRDQAESSLDSDNSTQSLQTSQTLKRSYKTAFLPPGSIRGFGNLPFSSAVAANHFPPERQNAQLKVFSQPEWQPTLCWTSDDSALGQAFTSFQRAAVPPLSQALRSPDDDSLVNVTFLFKGLKLEGPHDPDSWASQVQRTFTGHVPQTILIGGAYLLAMLMRWLTDPTPQNYRAVPLAIRPTLRQRLLPHPSSIDLVTTAPLRDALVDRMRDFLPSLVEAGISVNWPHPVNKALIGLRNSTNNGPDDCEYFVSPAFAAHVSNQDNWTFGRKILESFPELASTELVVSQEETLKNTNIYM